MKPKLTDLILHYMSKDNRTYLAHEIGSFLKIKPNSLHKTLSNMVKKGYLVREGHGLYRINPSIGLGVQIKPWRLQNLRMTATHFVGGERIKVPEIDSWGDPIEYPYKKGHQHEAVTAGLGLSEDDENRLSFIIGKKRNKLTFTVKAPLGYDLNGIQLAFYILDSWCVEHGILDRINWKINRGTELHQDYSTVDLDSMKGGMSQTRRDFMGNIEKIYQKAFGARRELKINQPMTRDAFMAQTQGGMDFGSIVQGQYMMNKQVTHAVDIMKDSRVNTYHMEKTIETRLIALENAFYRFADRIGVFMDLMDDEKA